MLLSLLVLTAPVPVDGLALPLRCLNSLQLASSGRSPVWINGIHPVRFEYRTHRSVESVARDIERELHQKGNLQRKTFQFRLSRARDGIRQQISIGLRGIWSDPIYDRKHGTHHVRIASIEIEEFPVDLSKPPRRWYRRAIAPIPPQPMIAVPFDTRYRTSMVSETYLDSLGASTKSPRHEGPPDTLIYTAQLPFALEVTQRNLRRWAETHGYSRTSYGSYSKSGPGVFEISPVAGPRRRTWVNLYFTRKRPTHPVYRGITK